MAPNYKLTYFNGTGRGEHIRYIFAYAGVEYEDVRIKKESWAELKPKTPFGKIPILEIDGKVVSQSNAIARYLAKQFNLVGTNDWESLKADELAEALGDYKSLSMTKNREQDPKKIEEIEKIQASNLEKFDKIIAGNPSGLLVGSEITWADLSYAAFFTDVLEHDADQLKPYPALNKLVAKINSHPNIKSWLERRPKSDLLPRGPPPKK